MSEYIPLSVPSLKGNEWKYLKECIDTEWVSSAGKYVGLFENKVAQYTGSKYAVACVNGTSALQISLYLAGVEPEDEVIVPSLTFIASVNAISYNNAIPIFMDSDEYYNLDIDKTIDFINKNTLFKNGFTYNKTTKRKIAAIMPVHVWGNAVRLNELSKICKKLNISIVEDASESLGTFYLNKSSHDKHTGRIGSVGCFSFNGNKIITTGGGGMIITDDSKLAEKAKYLTTQAKDDPVRYIHNEIGFNFRLTNVQAAIGVAQMEQLSKYLSKKKYKYKKYSNSINCIKGLELANVPDYADNNHWMSLIRINDQKFRINKELLMVKLEKNGIQTRPVWALNHKQKPYKNHQNYKIDNAEVLVSSSLCLPSSVSLKDSEIDKIVRVLNG